eukprot:CAMPEP_0117446980 /NCGR_PEP_ID=MMETSP0759-20121206/6631_1 /TAXON_ID=63605 /ORGANISM="Percolomonas cosmopolitus, Strain WS" /LENGTH=289 /DNA_ID=CAMNT_0005239285 /DNA_START=117 /DNA_END=986 /DNA_ORIENTATION=-
MQKYLRLFLNILQDWICGEKEFSLEELTNFPEEESVAFSANWSGKGLSTVVVRLLVITTEAPSQTWCSGMDLNQENQKRLKKMLLSKDQSSTRQLQENSPSPVHTLIQEEFLSLFQQVSSLEIPTLAYIRGPVLGGGLGLMLSCDYIVADASCIKDIFFQFAEVKRGLVPALISLFIVPRIGISVSKRLMMSGERISCEEAVRLGVVHEIAPQQEILDKYSKLFNEAAPNAVRLTKKLVHSYAQQNSNQLNLVLDVFRDMMLSEEAKYGISCFLKKQQPNWSEFVMSKM